MKKLYNYIFTILILTIILLLGFTTNIFALSESKTNNISETTSTTQAQTQSDQVSESQVQTNICQKTHDNGLYKIAVGKNSNKTIEVAGSDKSNNAKIDIWNYRKCKCTKILFRV